MNLHIQIARQRPSGLETTARDSLLAIREEELETAVVGEPAPEFLLPAAAGSVSAAHYSGRYAVTLSFLYGDG